MCSPHQVFLAHSTLPNPLQNIQASKALRPRTKIPEEPQGASSGIQTPRCHPETGSVLILQRVRDGNFAGRLATDAEANRFRGQLWDLL